jgi:hypothetical protein
LNIRNVLKRNAAVTGLKTIFLIFDEFCMAVMNSGSAWCILLTALDAVRERKSARENQARAENKTYS